MVSVLSVVTCVVVDIVTVLALASFIVMVNVVPSSDATVPTVGGVAVRPEPLPAPDADPVVVEGLAPLAVMSSVERRRRIRG